VDDHLKLLHDNINKVSQDELGNKIETTPPTVKVRGMAVGATEANGGRSVVQKVMTPSSAAMALDVDTTNGGMTGTILADEILASRSRDVGGSVLKVNGQVKGNLSESYKWGYWNTTEGDYKVRNGLWAGQTQGLWEQVTQTQQYVERLMADNVVGVYRGGAQCLEFATPASLGQPFGGTSEFFLDFGAGSFDGKMTFSDAANTRGGALFEISTAGGFRDDKLGIAGTITKIDDFRPTETRVVAPGDTVTNSVLKGDLRGITAGTLGGAFGANVSNGASYLGVFGTTKTKEIKPPQAPQGDPGT